MQVGQKKIHCFATRSAGGTISRTRERGQRAQKRRRARALQQRGLEGGSTGIRTTRGSGQCTVNSRQWEAACDYKSKWNGWWRTGRGWIDTAPSVRHLEARGRFRQQAGKRCKHMCTAAIPKLVALISPTATTTITPPEQEVHQLLPNSPHGHGLTSSHTSRRRLAS